MQQQQQQKNPTDELRWKVNLVLWILRLFSLPLTRYLRHSFGSKFFSVLRFLGSLFFLYLYIIRFGGEVSKPFAWFFYGYLVLAGWQFLETLYRKFSNAPHIHRYDQGYSRWLPRKVFKNVWIRHFVESIAVVVFAGFYIEDLMLRRYLSLAGIALLCVDVDCYRKQSDRMYAIKDGNIQAEYQMGVVKSKPSQTNQTFFASQID